MKIQLDRYGKAAEGKTQISRAMGILLLRRGKRLDVDIGNRVTPHALFSALNHIRAFHGDVHFTTQHARIEACVPLGETMPTHQACFYLGRFLLDLIERRHRIVNTLSLAYLKQDAIPNVPLALHSLTNLQLYKMTTSTALAQLPENALRHVSFIMPDGDITYTSANYRIRKLPYYFSWPADDFLLPLPIGEILPKAHDIWNNSLYHIALCTKRPLIHTAQMNLRLRYPSDMPHQDFVLGEQKWHEVTRILYPFAAPTEKPANYRLLTGAIITKTNAIIL